MFRIPSILMLCLTILASGRAGTNSVQRIGIEQGLSQSTVMSIVQDHEGFLWLGTWDGLNRYDGYSFVQYRRDPADSTSLSHNSVRLLFEDSGGRLWIGTASGGLNRFDRKRNRFIRYHTTDPSQKILNTGAVHMIKEDAAGRIWVQTSYALEQYDTSGNLVKRVDLRSMPATVFSKEMCRGGLIYIWSNKLIGTSADGTVMVMHMGSFTDDPRRSPDALSYREDSRGTSWVLSYQDGIFEYDWNDHTLKHRFRHTKEANSLSDNLVRTMVELSDGTLIFGTDGGLNIAHPDDGGRITGFTRMIHDPRDPTSINSNEVNTLYQDRSGVLWIGTKLGANKILPERKKFGSIPRSKPFGEMIQGNFPTAFLEESDTLLWIGSTNGLFQYNARSDSWILLDKLPGLTSPVIHTIHKDRKGRIWIGTRYGLNKYDAASKRFIPYLFDPDLPTQVYRNRHYAVVEDEEGILWFGTSSGVVRFDPDAGTQRRIFFDTIAGGQGNSNILSLLIEADTLWVGCNSQGLLKVNKRTLQFERYQHDPKVVHTLSNNQPMSMLKDKNGTIWIATLGGGLNRMERHGDSISFTHFSVRDGLLNGSLYGILEGDDGRLWVSSNYGIAQFSGTSGRFTSYTMSDGLPVHEYNQNSYHRGKSGSMYFGGINGILKFRPDQISINATPPQMAVTDFSIFREHRNDLLRSGDITLRYTQNFFSFEFSSLCFEMPEKNQYAYRLEGLENEWNYIGTRRFASFTNIDPGEYVFRVKGTNNDGVWNEEGAAVRITIVPPFWATVWFRIAAVMMFVGSIGGGVRYSAYRKYRRQIEALEQQKRIMEERQRTRDKIARDLHDDLASTVGSAGLFVETAKRTLKENAEQSREYLDKTSAILNEAEEAMSDIVWSVSPKHDSLNSLATRIRIVATDLCRANGIGCTVEVNGNTEVPLGDDVRRGFYLIFKEALNNVLKHSRATAVVIGIGKEQDRLILRVKDNGIGFGSGERTERLGGNGMNNMQKRADEMGGVLTVESVPEKGTSIEVVRQMTQLGH